MCLSIWNKSLKLFIDWIKIHLDSVVVFEMDWMIFILVKVAMKANWLLKKFHAGIDFVIARNIIILQQVMHFF